MLLEKLLAIIVMKESPQIIFKNGYKIREMRPQIIYLKSHFKLLQ